MKKKLLALWLSIGMVMSMLTPAMADNMTDTIADSETIVETEADTNVTDSAITGIVAEDDLNSDSQETEIIDSTEDLEESITPAIEDESADAPEEATDESEETEMMNVTYKTGSCTDVELLRYAYQFIGKKYATDGQRKGPNYYDCTGLVEVVYGKFGYVMPSGTTYYKEAKTISQLGLKEVAEKDALPGDLILWSGHVGIYLGDNAYLSALTSGVTISGISWFTGTNPKNYKIYRLPGVKHTLKTYKKAYPTMIEPWNANNGINVRWNAMSGASKYRVYYKESGASSWTLAGDTTATNYVVRNVLTPGKTYYFTCKALDANGNDLIKSVKGPGAKYPDKVSTSTMDPVGSKYMFVSQPKNTTVSITASGASVKWDKVPEATSYRVQYREKGSEWTQENSVVVTATNCTISKDKLTIGKTYQFTVRALGSDGSSSFYDKTGKEIVWKTPLAISSVTNTLAGPKLTWNKVTGASKYRVYYKIPGGEWKKYIDTPLTTMVIPGLKAGQQYYFRVRALNSDGSTYNMCANLSDKKYTYLKPPSGFSGSSSSTNLVIKWDAATGAAKYVISYKANASDAWTKLATVTKTSYTVPSDKVSVGKTYYFRVQTVSADGSVSYYDSDKKATRLAIPTLNSVSNANSGVTVSWSPVTGASKYRIYYKEHGTNANWTRYSSDVTGTKCTVGFTKYQSGLQYDFTVRAIAADSSMSYYDTTGKTITRLSQPNISKVQNTASGIKVTWDSVGGASNYRIYYKKDGESWQKYADYGKGITSCTVSDSVLTAGQKYYFTVKASASNGTNSSINKTGKELIRLKTPTLKSISNPGAGKVTITWSKVTGAKGYYIYRKKGTESWEKIGTVTDGATLKYTDKSASIGKTYYYTVKAYNGSSVSGHNSSGLKIKASKIL